MSNVSNKNVLYPSFESESFVLCLLCSKQELAYQNIEIKRKSSQSSSVFSLTSASLILQIHLIIL